MNQVLEIEKPTPVANLSHEARPRSRAIGRAIAESEAITRQQEEERTGREIRAISNIRKKRVATSQTGIRWKFVLIVAAVGVVCGGIGYSLAQTAGKVEVHVIERVEPVPTISAAVLMAALPASQPTTDLLAAVIALPPSPETIQKSLAASEPVPAMEKKVVQPVTITHPVSLVVKPVTRPVDRVSNQAPEDAEIVIVDKRPAPAAKPAIPPAVNTQIAVTTEYKVVNVLEGTVVVRQGQSVRQVKLGEKMPDGKILKSVNVDKGQFETLAL